MLCGSVCAEFCLLLWRQVFERTLQRCSLLRWDLNFTLTDFDRDDNLAPEGQKKAKEPKDKINNLASDVITNAAALDAAKKAHDDAAKKVKEAKHTVAMAGAKPFELYANLLSDEA